MPEINVILWHLKTDSGKKSILFYRGFYPELIPIVLEQHLASPTCLFSHLPHRGDASATTVMFGEAPASLFQRDCTEAWGTSANMLCLAFMFEKVKLKK